MVLYGALWLNLSAELTVTNLTIIILTQFLHYLTSLFLSHIEATTFDNSLYFRCTYCTITVLIQAIECLRSVKVRITCQTLSNMLCCNFYFEVNTPHVSEFDLGLSEEAVIATIAIVTMV